MNLSLPLLLGAVIVRLASSQDIVRLIPVVTSLEVKINYKYCNVSYTMENAVLGNQTIGFEIDLIRAVNDIKVTFAYYIVTSDVVGKNPLIYRNVDACDFIQRPTMNRMVKLVYDSIMKNSNFPSRCPVKPGHYYVRELRPASIKLPGFLPESQFLLSISYATGPKLEPIAKSLSYGKLTRQFGKLL